MLAINIILNVVLTLMFVMAGYVLSKKIFGQNNFGELNEFKFLWRIF